VRPLLLLLLLLLLVMVVVVVLRERKMKDSGQSVTRLFALLRVCDQPHDAFRRHLTVRYKRQRPDEIAVRYAHMKTK